MVCHCYEGHLVYLKVDDNNLLFFSISFVPILLIKFGVYHNLGFIVGIKRFIYFLTRIFFLILSFIRVGSLSSTVISLFGV